VLECDVVLSEGFADRGDYEVRVVDPFSGY